MQCVNCKHLKHIQKPIRFGKDIFDTGMVECTKYDLVLEYTSTRALNKRTCVEDEPQDNIDEILDEYFDSDTWGKE